ncbi:MAG: carboxypeptidase-like regulatory domain-containing protein [Bryobacteraceae bacterium]
MLLPTPNAPPISGVVVGSDGGRIQATVTAHGLTPPSVSATAETGPDGSFVLGGLPDGNYQLCVEDKGGTYLDPCAWSETQVIVAAKGSRPVSGFRLVMALGVKLEVRVNDAGRVLDPVAPPANRPRTELVVAAVTPRNIVLPVRFAGRTGAVRSHRIAVSSGARMFVGVLSFGANVNDPQGRPIEAGRITSLPITIPAGQNPPPVDLTVTGARP